MEVKFGDLTKVFAILFSERSIKVAAAALIVTIALVAATITIIIGWPWRAPWLSPTQQVLIVIELLACFALLWTIFFLLSRQELIDVFSKVRKQMSGRWLVTYSASVSYHETEARYVTCDIKENLIRKLEFEFAIVGSPIFQNQNGQIVKDIALRETDAGRYSLFYYFETERKLVDSLRSLLIFERDQRDEIIIETLGILNFEAPVSDKQSVEEMRGKWYDLNGNMMRILELIRLKKEADRNHEIFSPVAFRKIPVSDIHFDADMGSVTFSFQGKRD